MRRGGKGWSGDEKEVCVCVGGGGQLASGFGGWEE